MTGVHRRLVIDACTADVYDELAGADGPFAWMDGLLLTNDGAVQTLLTPAGDLVHARVIEALPGRRLVLSWQQPGDVRLPHGSTVRVDLAPLGDRTVLELTHSPTDQSAEGDEAIMSETNTCEWCGRAGEVIELAVRSEDGVTNFAQPVLCAVCSALLAVRPAGGRAWKGLLESDPGPAPDPASPGFQAWLDATDAVFVAAARSRVFDLLTESYDRKGNPQPDWLTAI